MMVKTESKENLNYKQVSQWRTDIFTELVTKVLFKIKRNKRVSITLILKLLFVKRFTFFLGTYDEWQFRTVALAWAWTQDFYDHWLCKWCLELRLPKKHKSWSVEVPCASILFVSFGLVTSMHAFCSYKDLYFRTVSFLWITYGSWKIINDALETKTRLLPLSKTDLTRKNGCVWT